MKDIEGDRKSKINELMYAVKIISMLLTAIIVWRSVSYEEIFEDNKMMNVDLYYNYVIIIIILVIFTGMYFLWSFSIKKKVKKQRIFKCIEAGIFLAIFTIVILMSGGSKSPYKYTYLFIIIPSVIEWGMKDGFIISIVSMSIIIGIDIYFVKGVEVNTFVEDDLVLSGIFFLTSWTLGFYINLEKKHIKKLQESANNDGLTGLTNHAHFCELLNCEIERAKDTKENVALIFMDLDYFKIYNDVNGHLKGDYLLRELAVLIKKCIRERDIPARYGGEEFVVLLPNTKEEEAVLIAENIRRKVEETYFFNEEQQPGGKVTSSIGVSVYPDKAKDGQELIKTADEALYKVKNNMKNKVLVYEK